MFAGKLNRMRMRDSRVIWIPKKIVRLGKRTSR
jgi:hypothetical protein